MGISHRHADNVVATLRLRREREALADEVIE